MNTQPDFLIVGSGFAGSITAMILRRLGYEVVMLERGRHPRFAIGESSTPLANLLLEELAAEFDLPELRPFCKWGSWQSSHPAVACGLKRGFSFFHHIAGHPIDPLDRNSQLLVAASPSDAIADTHWYRPDFDRFLAKAAVARGAVLLEEAKVTLIVDTDGGPQKWRVQVDAPEASVELTPRFIVDASGPNGFLHRAVFCTESGFRTMPRTQTLFSHFQGVGRMDQLFPELAPGTAGLPYPVDDAALHHVFEGGWIWVLRFNNGLVSAGVMADERLANELQLSEGAAAWGRLMDRFPSVGAQFEGATPAIPFRYQNGVHFLGNLAAGPTFALLPSAAAFVDPLLSNGFPLTLLGVQRLVRSIAKAGEARLPEDDWQNYKARTLGEAVHTAELIGALYRSMNDFPRFADLTRLYFAAASFSETVRRLNRHDLAPGFLLREHPDFANLLRRHCSGNIGSKALLEEIEPFNVAGLTDRTRCNWHPALAEDLLKAAPKVCASREQILGMLQRCGFGA